MIWQSVKTRKNTQAVFCIVAMAMLAMIPAANVARAQPEDPFGDDVVISSSSSVHQSPEQRFRGGAGLKSDPETDRLLRRVRQYIQDERFNLAVMLCQKILDESRNIMITHSDWVDRDIVDPRVVLFQKYQSVGEEVERLLAQLPPEGLRVYRLTADGEAKAILAKAQEKQGGDEQLERSLVEVVERFFISSEGDDAAYRLGCMRLEKYNFIGAAYLFRKILKDHPNSSVDRGALLLRLAVATARIGDLDGAKAMFHELEDLPGKPIPKRVLALVKQDIARVSVSSGRIDPAESSWLMALGRPNRTGHMKALPAGAIQSNNFRLTEMWQFEAGLELLSKSKGKLIARQTVVYRPSSGPFLRSRIQSKNPPTERKDLVEKWKQNQWFPTTELLLDQGKIYFKAYEDSIGFKNPGGYRVTCLNVSTGELEWKSLEARPPEMFVINRNDSSVFGDDVMLFGDRISKSMSISDGILYAIEGPENISALSSEMFYSQTQGITARGVLNNSLAAYDAKSGKQYWRVPSVTKESTGKKEGEGSEGDEQPARIRFLAAPVPYANLLISPVRDSSGLWLYALAAHKDKTSWKARTVWKTFLCDQPQGGASPWSTVGVAVEGGDVYVSSGSGLIFAIDAASGSIRWAIRYMRFNARGLSARSYRRSFTSIGMNPQGWIEDVIIPSRGILVVMPSDAKVLFAFDRRTGKLLYKSFKGEAQYCLGIVGDELFVAGRNIVRCLNIPSGKLRWDKEIAPSMGRGALTDKALYIPVEDTIVQFDLATGKKRSQVTVTTKVGDPVGNLVTDGQRIYVAGMERVYALMDMQLFLKQLSREIDADDADAAVLARLKRMELYSKTGKHQSAVDDLHAAYRQLVKLNKPKEARIQLHRGILFLDLAQSHPLLALQMLGESQRDAAVKPQSGDAASYPDELNRVGAIFESAFNSIRNGNTSSDAVETVLTATRLCHDRYLLASASQTLQAIVGKQHLKPLEQALKNKNPRIREVAVPALAKLLGKQPATQIRPLLGDSSDRVRLAAARVFANQGNRISLKPLGELLASKDLAVRIDSVRALRDLTGKNFRYTAYEDSSARKTPTQQWQQWIEKESASAKLSYPLGNSRYKHGRILICLSDQNKMIELDVRSGKKVWEADLKDHAVKNPSACQGLPNGGRLVATSSPSKLFEFSPGDKKKIIRQSGMSSKYPMSIHRLDNGNTLIACYQARQVIEVDKEFKILSQQTIDIKNTDIKNPGQPMDAQRLANGNTLIALVQGARGEIIELDRLNKKIVWQLTGLNAPSTVQRLENGNTLICFFRKSGGRGSGQVLEYNRAKQVVWTLSAKLNRPFRVQRLPNGNTLVSDSSGLSEYDRSGKEIKKWLTGKVWHFHRY